MDAISADRHKVNKTNRIESTVNCTLQERERWCRLWLLISPKVAQQRHAHVFQCVFEVKTVKNEIMCKSLFSFNGFCFFYCRMCIHSNSSESVRNHCFMFSSLRSIYAVIYPSFCCTMRGAAGSAIQSTLRPEIKANVQNRSFNSDHIFSFFYLFLKFTKQPLCFLSHRL